MLSSGCTLKRVKKQHLLMRCIVEVRGRKECTMRFRRCYKRLIAPLTEKGMTTKGVDLGKGLSIEWIALVLLRLKCL